MPESQETLPVEEVKTQKRTRTRKTEASSRDESNALRQRQAKEQKAANKVNETWIELKGDEKTGKVIEVRRLVSGSKHSRFIGSIKDKATKDYLAKCKLLDRAKGIYSLPKGA